MKRESMNCWKVIARIDAELRRQSATGKLKITAGPDRDGKIAVTGVIDLAALAAATEKALAETFAPDRNMPK